mmetsp:Transcript_29398/g.73833  ORF Transcript_29398/g.73833 Transcript_29398/m.73833 type:complete len:254 (+) Transcript_29398:1129-1890(+)
MDETTKLCALCHLMLCWNEILAVGDGHSCGIILEGMPVECKRVQYTTQHPYVPLFVNSIPLAVVQLDVGHLGRPVQHGHSLIDVLLQPQQLCPGQLLRRHHLCTAGAKVAQLPIAITAIQHVFHLQVSVLDRRLLSVQVHYSCCYLRKGFQDLARRKLAVFAVHVVQKVAVTTQLQQDLDGLAAAGRLRRRVTEALDDVRMRCDARQYLRLTLSGREAAGDLHALLATDLLQSILLARPVIGYLHHCAKCPLS